jgi:sucrose-6-phosphate hydrolase SacC (GH32 family)
LKKWTFQSAVDGFFECPDLVELPIDGNPKDSAWLMFGCDNRFLIGKFDGKTFTPEPGRSKSNGSYGPYLYFYAAQTFNDAPGGRRIQMGCMKCDFKNTSFNHVLSVPLELTLHRTADGIKLHFYPVRELEQLREGREDFADITLTNNETIIANVDADLKDINVEFAIPEGAKTIGIKIGGTRLTFDAQANQLTCRDGQAPLKPIDGKIRLRVLTDRRVLEIFANDGLIYMPVAMPVSEAGEKGVSIFAQGDGVVKASLTIYRMQSVWPK